MVGVNPDVLSRESKQILGNMEVNDAYFRCIFDGEVPRRVCMNNQYAGQRRVYNNEYSMMSFSDAYNIYMQCIQTARVAQDYTTCAQSYQNNLVGAEFSLATLDSEVSMMTYTDAANIYTNCISTAKTSKDYTTCATQYQNNLAGAEYGLFNTQDETALWGISWDKFKKEAKELKDKAKAKAAQLEDKVLRKVYGSKTVLAASVDSELVQSKSNSFFLTFVVLTLVALAAAGALYIKSKRSKSESMLVRPSQVK